MLWAIRRSVWPGNSLMRAEQEPEPITCLLLVLFRAGSKSPRSPASCNRLRRAGVPQGYQACLPCRECMSTSLPQRSKLRLRKLGERSEAGPGGGPDWSPGLSGDKVHGPLPYPVRSGRGTYRNPKGLTVNLPVGKVILPS